MAGGVRCLGEPLVPGCVLPGPVVRVRQLKEQFAPQRLIPWPEAVQQLERLLKMADRDFGRYFTQRALGRQAIVPDRLSGGANACGCAEVVREFGRRDVETALKRLADPLVEPGSVAPAQPGGSYPPRQR